MKKTFLFIALYFYGLDAAVINSDISVAQLPKSKISIVKTAAAGNMVYIDMSNLSLNDINGIENLEITTNNRTISMKHIPRLILNLSNNQITDISSLSSLPNLAKLNLSNNQITDISSLNSLIKLWTLNLSNNQITDISSLNSLPKLRKLDLSNNQIKKYTDPSMNEITDISNLSSLYTLEYLDLSNNQIKYIPILSLPNLKDLNLSNNKLISIFNLKSPNLFRLDISNNQLILFDNICEFKKLKILDLSNNELPILPNCIIKLTNLIYLNIYNNENIKLYVEKLKKEPSRIILTNQDGSINITLSNFLTCLAEKNGLTFRPSNQKKTYNILDQLLNDIKKHCIYPYFGKTLEKIK